MRYFSQLARETTARVIPSRQPAWLPPIAQVLQEGVAEWSVESPVSGAAPKVGQVSRGEELSTDRTVPRRESADESADINPARRAHTFKPEERESEGSRERVVIEKHFHQELASTPQVRNSGETSGPASIPSSRSPDPHEPGISEIEARPQRVQRIVLPDQQIKPATLQDVISEITRRQEEFERSYRASGRSSGPVRSTETARAEVRTERETEGVSLNIGSIVVQAAPEPPVVKAPPRPAPRGRAEVADHRWKRSFLDRY